MENVGAGLARPEHACAQANLPSSTVVRRCMAREGGLFARRRSLRLRAHDYASSGAYFVTICTHGRAHTLATPPTGSGEMRLTTSGRLAFETWHQLPTRFPRMSADAIVVMPNHVHGIVFLRPQTIETGAGGRTRVAPTSLSAIIGAYKSISTRAINAQRGTSAPVWQRSYFERVIRNQPELDAIREYIANNPKQWTLDRENRV